jgi:hypothetical protein
LDGGTHLGVSFDGSGGLLDLCDKHDTEAVLSLVANAKNARTYRWWKPTVGGFYCHICDSEFDTSEPHLATHELAVQALCKSGTVLVRQKEFTRWTSLFQMDPPHEIHFDLPCVTFAVWRLVRLYGLLPVEIVQNALKRTETDPDFTDAIEAAADVPNGITTLLTDQGLGVD